MDKVPSIEAGGQGAAAAPANSRESLNPEVEIALLRRDVEDLKARKGKKWYEFTGIAIGLVAGGLALPRAIVDVKHFIWRDTKTSVHWDVPVKVSYSPPDRSMSLTVPFLINNEGTAKDEVENVDVSIGLTGVPGAKAHTINARDIQFQEGATSFPFPFYVDNETSRSLKVIVAVPATLQDEILAGRDVKQVRVLFTLRNGTRTPAQTFCFDFAKEDYEDETASKEKNLLSPEC